MRRRLLQPEQRARRRLGGRGGQRLRLAAQRPVERIDHILRPAEPPRQGQARHARSARRWSSSPSRSSVRTVSGSSRRAATWSGASCRSVPLPLRERGAQAVRGRGARTPPLPPQLRSSPLPRGERVIRASAQAAAAVGAMAMRARQADAGEPLLDIASQPASPPNKCATPLTSSRSPSAIHLDQRRPAAGPSREPLHQRRIACGIGGQRRPAPDRAPAHRSAGRRARAPRSAAALVTAWMIGPCVPSTVRTTGHDLLSDASGGKSLAFAQRSIASAGNQMEAIRFMRERPAARRQAARAEQLASQAGNPGARGSSGFGQRRRARDPPAHPRAAEVRGAAEPDQPAGHGRLRSDATASRRVAVKSSALGSPQNSPITADSAAHLTPSSIAHSASRASRASTWMRF